MTPNLDRNRNRVPYWQSASMWGLLRGRSYQEVFWLRKAPNSTLRQWSGPMR